ncbi:hypothetical protein SAMN05428995_10430 [Loktanella sp. DSM 29012]|nr:hypothetical protein SAMN05428995_10430 [Loktanella sp. DSM 29012]
MNKRHENIIAGRMDELVARGSTKLYWWELYLWYKSERLSKSVYRDIQTRYESADGADELRFQDLSEALHLIEASKFKPLTDLT